MAYSAEMDGNIFMTYKEFQISKEVAVAYLKVLCQRVSAEIEET
jgi:hypothetical protein